MLYRFSPVLLKNYRKNIQRIRCANKRIQRKKFEVKVYLDWFKSIRALKIG